jgi:hypothetical protein
MACCLQYAEGTETFLAHRRHLLHARPRTGPQRALTTRDWPRRQSPAAKMPSMEVANSPYCALKLERGSTSMPGGGGRGREGGRPSMRGHSREAGTSVLHLQQGRANLASPAPASTPEDAPSPLPKPRQRSPAWQRGSHPARRPGWPRAPGSPWPAGRCRPQSRARCRAPPQTWGARPRGWAATPRSQSPDPARFVDVRP